MDTSEVFKNGFLAGYLATILVVIVLGVRERSHPSPADGAGAALLGIAVGVLFGVVALGYCAIAGCA